MLFDSGDLWDCSSTRWIKISGFDSRLEIEDDHHEGMLCEASIMTPDQRDNTNVI